MTSTIKTSRRGRALVGTVLASAASVVGMIAVAAPAQAADQYIAVALGYVSENPPVLMAGGSSISGNQDQAFQGALTNCSPTEQATASSSPSRPMSAQRRRRTGTAKRWEHLLRRSRAAQSAALAKLQNQTDAKVIVSGCTNGNTAPPPPPNNPPPPPPAPKLGPTVSFNKVLGGLESSHHRSQR